MIVVKKYVVGPWKENSYFISSDLNAWLIDPGQDFEQLKSNFNTDQYKLDGIINTHGHFDHVGAVAEFQNFYDIPFYIHNSDKRLLHQANLFRKLAGDSLITKTPKVDFDLSVITSLKINNHLIRVHFTPGHSSGSVCFELDNMLFSGDLFFPNAIGRTDLPGGNKQQITSSIDYVLANFIGYKIFPGHGEEFILTSEIAAKLKSEY